MHFEYRVVIVHVPTWRVPEAIPDDYPFIGDDPSFIALPPATDNATLR